MCRNWSVSGIWALAVRIHGVHEATQLRWPTLSSADQLGGFGRCNSSGCCLGSAEKVVVLDIPFEDAGRQLQHENPVELMASRASHRMKWQMSRLTLTTTVCPATRCTSAQRLTGKSRWLETDDVDLCPAVPGWRHSTRWTACGTCYTWGTPTPCRWSSFRHRTFASRTVFVDLCGWTPSPGGPGP